MLGATISAEEVEKMFRNELLLGEVGRRREKSGRAAVIFGNLWLSKSSLAKNLLENAAVFRGRLQRENLLLSPFMSARLNLEEAQNRTTVCANSTRNQEMCRVS
jgi:hypothetical protein